MSNENHSQRYISFLKKILSHNREHALKFSHKGQDVYLCARCTGIILGYLSLSLTVYVSGKQFLRLSAEISGLLSLLLMTPAILDWLTVKIGFRAGNNPLRTFTGLFLGMGILLYGWRFASYGLDIYGMVPAIIFWMLIMVNYKKNSTFRKNTHRLINWIQKRGYPRCREIHGDTRGDLGDDFEAWCCIIILVIAGFAALYFWSPSAFWIIIAIIVGVVIFILWGAFSAKKPSEYKVEARQRIAEPSYRRPGPTPTPPPPPPPGPPTETPEAAYDMAIDFAHSGRYKEAIRWYDRALTGNPDDPDIWNNKGLAFAHLGRYKKALRCYDRALGLNPRYALAWNNRGVALYNLKRYKEALECYDRALAIDPDLETARMNRRSTLLYM